RKGSGVGQKLVVLDDGSNRHLAAGAAALHSQDASFAAHADALGESNFWWQGQCEVDGGAGLNRRIEQKTDPTRADVACLRLLLGSITALANTQWQTQREPSRCPLLGRLSLSHATSWQDECKAWRLGQGLSRQFRPRTPHQSAAPTSFFQQIRAA